MTAEARTADGPARLAAHELVLLHGQPGSPADWQPVIAAAREQKAVPGGYPARAVSTSASPSAQVSLLIQLNYK